MTESQTAAATNASSSGDPNSTTANVTAPSYTVTVGGTGVQPEGEQAKLAELARQAEEWRTRFTGLQGKYQQEQRKWADDSAKVLELADTLNRLTGEKEAMGISLTQLTEKAEQAELEREVARAELERVKIVTTEFPDLVPFLGDELLPDGAGDELRGKLKLFSDKIGAIKQEKITNIAKGSSPNDAPTAQDKSSQALLAQAIDAFRKGDNAGYNDLYQQYVKSLGGVNG